MKLLSINKSGLFWFMQSICGISLLSTVKIFWLLRHTSALISCKRFEMITQMVLASGVFIGTGLRGFGTEIFPEKVMKGVCVAGTALPFGGIAGLLFLSTLNLDRFIGKEYRIRKCSFIIFHIIFIVCGIASASMMTHRRKQSILGGCSYANMEIMLSNVCTHDSLAGLVLFYAMLAQGIVSSAYIFWMCCRVIVNQDDREKREVAMAALSGAIGACIMFCVVLTVHVFAEDTSTVLNPLHRFVIESAVILLAIAALLSVFVVRVRISKKDQASCRVTFGMIFCCWDALHWVWVRCCHLLIQEGELDGNEGEAGNEEEAGNEIEDNHEEVPLSPGIPY